MDSQLDMLIDKMLDIIWIRTQIDEEILRDMQIENKIDR